MIHRQNGLSQLTAELDRLPNLRVNVLEEAKGVPSAEVLSSKCNTWTVRRTLVVSQPWNSWRLSGGHRRRAELLAFPPEGSRASRRRSEGSCRRREPRVKEVGTDQPRSIINVPFIAHALGLFGGRREFSEAFRACGP